VEFLMENCFHSGGFFQDMIHSGINAYLTLGIAQTLLRSGDARYRRLVEAVSGLASPTGQWPEAIHPRTGGGCMGDGQHGWAAAEWVMMIRSLFVREEKESLILLSGLFPGWLEADQGLSFGPTLTPFGPLSLEIKREGDGLFLHIDARFRERTPRIKASPPGFKGIEIFEHDKPHELEPM
jgi:hypothetical protein